MSRAKLIVMPARPSPRARQADWRFIEGQRILVEAIRYLVRTDVQRNVAAVELLSEHFRTRFRMSDTPLVITPKNPS